MLTRKDVEARLHDLRQQFSRAKETLAAIDGALQDCEHWLTVIAQRETSAEQTPPSDEQA